MKNKPYFITYKLNNYFLKNPLYRVAVAHSYALLDEKETKKHCAAVLQFDWSFLTIAGNTS